jgi:hypothetical protein
MGGLVIPPAMAFRIANHGQTCRLVAAGAT